MESPLDNDARFDDRIKEKLNELGMPEEFQRELLNQDDDWSFVIKCHALLEAGASSALLRYFGSDKLEELFSELDMGNKKCGKVAFLKKLEVVRAQFIPFLYAFGELRNELVHNIKNVTFSLKGPHSEKVQKKVQQLLKETQRIWNTPPLDQEAPGEPLDWEIFEKIPRGVITSALTWCLWEFMSAEHLGFVKSKNENLGKTVFSALTKEI